MKKTAIIILLGCTIMTTQAGALQKARNWFSNREDRLHAMQQQFLKAPDAKTTKQLRDECTEIAADIIRAYKNSQANGSIGPALARKTSWGSELNKFEYPEVANYLLSIFNLMSSISDRLIQKLDLITTETLTVAVARNTLPSTRGLKRSAGKPDFYDVKRPLGRFCVNTLMADGGVNPSPFPKQLEQALIVLAGPLNSAFTNDESIQKRITAMRTKFKKMAVAAREKASLTSYKYFDYN